MFIGLSSKRFAQNKGVYKKGGGGDGGERGHVLAFLKKSCDTAQFTQVAFYFRIA